MSDLWITVADATTYYETRLGADTYWPASLTDAQKTAALTTAQQDIENCEDPAYYFASAYIIDPTDAMKYAVCEQALFLLRSADMEARRDLQIQGVTRAGLVEETYTPGQAGIIICPRAQAFLHTFESGSGNWFEMLK